MNSKGHAMTVALVILATRGAPRAIEFRRHELPELLFFRPLSYLACAMKGHQGERRARLFWSEYNLPHEYFSQLLPVHRQHRVTRWVVQRQVQPVGQTMCTRLRCEAAARRAWSKSSGGPRKAHVAPARGFRRCRRDILWSAGMIFLDSAPSDCLNSGNSSDDGTHLGTGALQGSAL
jgi:hypothetical protein